MLTTSILVTAAFLPVYLLLRAPFMRLPLHVDTGFYVSNNTIATGRIDFSKGWNAHFAGCSKVVPELFYSLIYLVHCRGRKGGSAAGSSSFKYASRFYASLYNYLTAVAVGVLAFQLAGGDVRFYFAGLIVFALLSSEPHWGVYFECGELFGALGNVVSMSILLYGLEHASPWLVGAAAFIWGVEACFVKLSSGIAMVVVFGAVLIVSPGVAGQVVIGTACAGALYLAWIVKQGQNPLALVGAIGRHESSCGQRADWRVIVDRLREKTRCLLRSIRRQPIVPAFALAGIILSGPRHELVWVYAAAVLLAYLIQATDCWYYQIPLLPPLALVATGPVVKLTGYGSWGPVILAALVIVWILHNSARAISHDALRLSDWCWRGYRPGEESLRNLLLEEAAGKIRGIVANESLLIYGPFNQAYALCDASYTTPIVAPEYYLDDVSPGWQSALSDQLVKDPPRFVLDTSNSFAAQTARESLSLDYRLTSVFEGEFRLYELSGIGENRAGVERALTYAPQTRAQLSAEESLSGLQVSKSATEAGKVVTAGASDDRDIRSSQDDVAGRNLSGILSSLFDRGYRRIAIYGAGRFTIRLAEIYRAAQLEVVVVLDDRHDRHGDTFLGWPIAPLSAAEDFDVDAIVISTDRFTRPMAARARAELGGRIAVFTIDPPRAARRQNVDAVEALATAAR